MFNSDDFLQRLRNYDVGSIELVDYLARGENHFKEIAEYIIKMDMNFANNVVEQARLRCVYDISAREFLMKSPVGIFL